jgi:hypothetical protein
MMLWCVDQMVTHKVRCVEAESKAKCLEQKLEHERVEAESKAKCLEQKLEHERVEAESKAKCLVLELEHERELRRKERGWEKERHDFMMQTQAANQMGWLQPSTSIAAGGLGIPSAHPVGGLCFPSVVAAGGLGIPSAHPVGGLCFPSVVAAGGAPPAGAIGSQGAISEWLNTFPADIFDDGDSLFS